MAGLYREEGREEDAVEFAAEYADAFPEARAGWFDESGESRERADDRF